MSDITLIIESVTGQDIYGNDVYGPTEIPLQTFDYAFDPGLSSEVLNGRDMVTTKPTLYLRNSTLTLDALDRVQVGSVIYDVDGQPQYINSPFDPTRKHTVIKLTETTG